MVPALRTSGDTPPFPATGTNLLCISPVYEIAFLNTEINIGTLFKRSPQLSQEVEQCKIT